MENHTHSRRSTALLLVLGAAGILYNFSMVHTTRAGRNVDFDTFYAAGKLAGTGHLYDWDSIRAEELRYKPSNPLPFGRIPFVAMLMKPLSFLPYDWAAAVWLCLGLAAFGGFAALWPSSRRMRSLAVACWSFPAAMCLAFGQDTIILLFMASVGLWLLRQGRQWEAGLAFSSFISKPHLAVLLPVWLAAQGKWKAIAGGAAGGLVMVLLSFAIEGYNWPMRALASAPGLASDADRMPNLRGFLSLAGGGLVLEVALGAAVAAVFWLANRRLNLTAGAALALAGGLLLSHHAYEYDAVELIPVLLLVYESDSWRELRIWALALWTPLAYIALLRDRVWPAQLLITGFMLALFVSEAVRLGRKSAAAAPH